MKQAPLLTNMLGEAIAVMRAEPAPRATAGGTRLWRTSATSRSYTSGELVEAALEKIARGFQ